MRTMRRAAGEGGATRDRVDRIEVLGVRAEDALDDPLHLRERLAGQADHEVQLERGVAGLEGGVDGPLDHLVGDGLADDVAHPLRRRLGRERDRDALGVEIIEDCA